MLQIGQVTIACRIVIPQTSERVYRRRHACVAHCELPALRSTHFYCEHTCAERPELVEYQTIAASRHLEGITFLLLSFTLFHRVRFA